MNIDHERLPILEGKKPEFSWLLVAIHFAVASFLAWVAISIPRYNETVRPFVKIVSSVIPTVAGMGQLSPHAQWGEVYFLFCIVGSPFYIRFFWKFAAYSIAGYVKEQQPLKFWLSTVTMLLLAAGMLFFLKPSRHSYSSIRSVDLISVLMKESYLAYGLMAMLLMIVFSFCLSVSVKAIHLRIVN